MDTIDTIGNDNQHSNFGGRPYVFGPLIATNTGTIKSLGVNFSAVPTGECTVAIYSDIGGVADGLIAQSESTPIIATGWNDIPMSGLNIIAGTSYWLAIEVNSDADIFFNPAGNWAYDTEPYGTFPPTTFANWTTSAQLYMRLTYQTVTKIDVTGGTETGCVPGASGGMSGTYGAWIVPIIASDSGVLESVGVNFRQGGNGNFVVAIYDDNFNLLGGTTSAPTISGWNDAPLTGVKIIKGNHYYLFADADNGSDCIPYTYPYVPTCYDDQSGFSFGTFPNPYPTNNTYSVGLNLRMTYMEIPDSKFIYQQGISLANYKKFTTSGTFTVPITIDSALVKATGGGGGGGGGGQNLGVIIAGSGGGGGGGAGETIVQMVGLGAGDTISITIGAGGLGGHGTTNATDGTDSSFGTFVIAHGGKHGLNGGACPAGSLGGAGGYSGSGIAGGTADNAGTNSIIIGSGGGGGGSSVGVGYKGGDCAESGVSNAGGAGGAGVNGGGGGGGGASFYGNGSNGSNASSQVSPAPAPNPTATSYGAGAGGGGGTACTTLYNPSNGGQGANGILEIWW